MVGEMSTPFGSIWWSVQSNHNYKKQIKSYYQNSNNYIICWHQIEFINYIRNDSKHCTNEIFISIIRIVIIIEL